MKMLFVAATTLLTCTACASRIDLSLPDDRYCVIAVEGELVGFTLEPNENLDDFPPELVEVTYCGSEARDLILFSETQNTRVRSPALYQFPRTQRLRPSPHINVNEVRKAFPSLVK